MKDDEEVLRRLVLFVLLVVVGCALHMTRLIG
jgi:hypothetical protein